MTDNKLIELTTVAGRLSAEAILSYLQAFDIQGMISMEAVGSVFPLTVGELGEVQILVRQEDYEKASQILDKYYQQAASVELLDEDEALSDLNRLDGQNPGEN
jgi:hypothetical protein